MFHGVVKVEVRGCDMLVEPTIMGLRQHVHAIKEKEMLFLIDSPSS